MRLSEDFVAQMDSLLEPDELGRFLESMEKPPVVSVRRNKNKSHEFVGTSDLVKWCNRGAYLSERKAFTFDPIMHSGGYYVQDASSMIFDAAIKALALEKPVRYLDLCAAPGGKTTTAIDALPENSLIVANEISGTRSQVLRENIIKWGCPNCVVTNNDNVSLGKLHHFFDIISTDVPCSGEGMMRKDDEALAQWTPALVTQCVARQREIIDAVWGALRPGGVLLYSTCTFNRQENEEMINHIMSNYGAFPIDLKFPVEWNIRKGIDVDYPCYRFMPHCTKGEGLFLCALRKSGEDDEEIKWKPVKRTVTKIPETVSSMLENREWTWQELSGKYIAIPDSHSSEVSLLQEKLRVLYAGVEVAQVKGRDIVPIHSLAMSLAISKHIPKQEIDYEKAIAYLRGDVITLDGVPKGYVIVSHKGLPLGFVKNIGSRANNLYPKEWRIRSSHFPESSPEIVK